MCVEITLNNYSADACSVHVNMWMQYNTTFLHVRNKLYIIERSIYASTDRTCFNPTPSHFSLLWSTVLWIKTTVSMYMWTQSSSFNLLKNYQIIFKVNIIICVHVLLKETFKSNPMCLAGIVYVLWISFVWFAGIFPL